MIIDLKKRKNSKSVERSKDGVNWEQFHSIGSAATETRTDRRNIQKVLQGYQRRHHGYYWRYSN